MGELKTFEDLSYLDVVPSSMISKYLSPSEMLLLHALTKYWSNNFRQMKTEVISRPTRSVSQKTKVFFL